MGQEAVGSVPAPPAGPDSGTTRLECNLLPSTPEDSTLQSRPRHLGYSPSAQGILKLNGSTTQSTTLAYHTDQRERQKAVERDVKEKTVEKRKVVKKHKVVEDHHDDCGDGLDSIMKGETYFDMQDFDIDTVSPREHLDSFLFCDPDHVIKTGQPSFADIHPTSSQDRGKLIGSHYYQDFMSVMRNHPALYDTLPAGTTADRMYLYFVRVRRIYPQTAPRDFAYRWDGRTKLTDPDDRKLAFLALIGDDHFGYNHDMRTSQYLPQSIPGCIRAPVYPRYPSGQIFMPKTELSKSFEEVVKQCVPKSD